MDNAKTHAEMFDLLSRIANDVDAGLGLNFILTGYMPRIKQVVDQVKEEKHSDKVEARTTAVLARKEDYHEQIYSGYEERTAVEVLVDPGGQNRLFVAEQDPPALLFLVDGKAFKVSVPELAAAVVRQALGLS